MDIRDFKETPPVPASGTTFLENIYSLQKQLVDHYIGIEGLPPYPLNVNTKPSQVLLKDFTGRVIEELAEGYESHLEVQKIVHENQYFTNPLVAYDKPIELMVSHLQNLNEEQADAMHFMVELLIYANIQPEDINKWLDGKVVGLILFKEDDILDKAMEVGYYNIMEGGISASYPTKDLGRYLTEEQMGYIRGGRYFASEVFDISNKFLWAITYAINISRNCLKNKPWKQSGVMTNETLYQSKLVEAFVYMAGYFKFLGMNSYDIYYLYFKKNLANQFRIKSNY